MIAPLLRDDELLADIALAPEDAGVLHLWWIGQSGFLLKYRDEYALFDPYLSDSLSRKYAGTNREHVRMTERCLGSERLGFVRLVFSSHMHTDHFDPETLVLLAKAVERDAHRLKLILPRSGLATTKTRLGDTPIEYLPLNATEEAQVGSFRIKAIAAAHPTVERDEHGMCLFLGFIVRCGKWTVYHSGDSLWHPDLLRVLSVERPDIALLPINGNRPERGVAGNLNGAEAAALANACGASLAIPHHFEMFEFNTEAPDEFVSACTRLSQDYQLLRCGERGSFAPPERPRS